MVAPSSVKINAASSAFIRRCRNRPTPASAATRVSSCPGSTATTCTSAPAARRHCVHPPGDAPTSMAVPATGRGRRRAASASLWYARDTGTTPCRSRAGTTLLSPAGVPVPSVPRSEVPQATKRRIPSKATAASAQVPPPPLPGRDAARRAPSTAGKARIFPSSARPASTAAAASRTVQHGRRASNTRCTCLRPSSSLIQACAAFSPSAGPQSATGRRQPERRVAPGG
mmetsp:Transcript_32305/g.49977  ORF Transcript_32305/g.49977 Transcript_32305/m.49977 type:complete len:228 (-) Transcript_32305:588-1271(-)